MDDLTFLEKKVSVVEAAQAQELLANIKLRVFVAVTVVLLFAVLNTAVIILIGDAHEQDVAAIQQKIISADQRLITENVYMSLIAGTVAQVATILLGITRFLFPASTTSDKRS